MAIIIITEFTEGLLCKATNLVVVWAWSHDNEVLYWTKGLCQDSCAPVLHPHSILRTWGQAAQTPGDTSHFVLPVTERSPQLRSRTGNPSAPACDASRR